MSDEAIYATYSDDDDKKIVDAFLARNPMCATCSAQQWKPGPMVSALALTPDGWWKPLGGPLAVYITMICEACNVSVFLFAYAMEERPITTSDASTGEVLDDPPNE